MGKVYEALKRAAERSNTNGNGTAVQMDESHSNGDGHTPPALLHTVAAPAVHTDAAAVPAAPDELEDVLRDSTVFQSPLAADASSSLREGSAFNEHTESRAGKALSGSNGSRVAGATLDAVSSARVREFPSLEIIPARVEPHLVSITSPRTPYAERYRSLRTRVLHAGEQNNVQTVVITSSGIMEGKTVTALNLAWQLAQADGVSALLIDGDLRHPCACDYLALDAPTGLSEVLAGEATLEDSIVRLEPAGLHLLPGGVARDDVADLLSGPRFAAVLTEARRMFDYIIIDAPPLGIFTDAAVLINRADAALLVVRAGKVRFSQLDRLLEGLPHERILGVILNGAEEQLSESDYYYYRRGETGDSRRHRRRGGGGGEETARFETVEEMSL